MPPTDASFSFASLLCAGAGGPAPKVAVALGGGARTFSHALVSESIKANLIGGSSGARVDVFAYLKLQDVRGENNKAAAAPAKREQVERALRRLGVAAQDYVIASGTTPEPPACNASQGYRPFVDKAPTPGQGKQTKANRDSFAAQVTTKKLCYDLIVRREERQGWRYDYVLLARPDLTWWKPVAPWCLWLNSHLPDGAPTKGPMRYDRSGGVQLKPVVGFSMGDHALVVPRAHATRFFHEPYVAYYGCRAPFGPGQMVESWMHTHGHMDELVDSDTFLPVTLTRSQSAGTVHLQGNCNTNGRLRITASVVDRQSMCNALFATNPSNADRKESGVAPGQGVTSWYHVHDRGDLRGGARLGS